MIYAFTLFFALLSVTVPAFASEKRVEFNLSVGTLHHNPLRYCDKKYIDFLKDTYGMQCEYNEPFLLIEPQGWAPKDREDLQKQWIDPITLVPFKYFIQGDVITQRNDRFSSDAFKKLNDILFSFSKTIQNQENKFILKLSSEVDESFTDFENYPPGKLLHQFKTQSVRCMPGHILNENGWRAAYVDTTDLEKELCEASFTRENGYVRGFKQYKQGPNGYFGDSIKEEKSSIDTSSTYSYFKQPLFYLVGLGSLVVVVALYKKFYC